MKIGEVMEYTGLTKKAVIYYEEQGLIKPSVNKDNNYREYSQDDICKFIQISILRQMDISIKDIKLMLLDPDKIKDVLQNHLTKLDNDIRRIENSKNILESCLGDLNDVSKPLSVLTDKLLHLNNCLQMDARTREGFMKKQLQRIFPGNFGRIIFITYGYFLSDPINTNEKEAAWISMVKYLDDVEALDFPDEIRPIYENLSEEQLEKIEEVLTMNIKKIVSYTVEEFEDYKKNKLESIKNNQDLKTEMIQFNESFSQKGASLKSKLKEMGYYKNFENNIKILSNDYIKYIERMASMENAIKSTFGIHEDGEIK